MAIGILILGWATRPPGVYRFNPRPPAEPPDANAGRDHDG
jgi:hypothetical protein